MAKRAGDSSVDNSSTKRRTQVFIPKYTEEWPCIKASRRDETLAYCEICVSNFSIKHGGRDDVRRHVAGKKHAELALQASKTQDLSNFFKKKSSIENNFSTMKAEMSFIDFALEHNIPLAAMDKLTKVVKKSFPDSEIARTFQCGRSKSTALVKEISADAASGLIETMKKSPFTISTDGSNDIGSLKLFPIVVRTVNPETREVRSDVLSVPTLEGPATGENIFRLIEKELVTHNIPWSNCLALGCDNANVMVGRKKGVYAYMLEAHKNIYLSGCICHLIHISAAHGAACLPINVDQLLIDVFYYLERSSKRSANFKHAQLQQDLKNTKILKHVSTRWLSIGRCLSRLLENWEALLIFFKEEEKIVIPSNKNKVETLRKTFQSPTNRLYCLFLVEAIKLFEQINVELQTADPSIHLLKGKMERLLQHILLRFVKPCAMISKTPTEVQFQLAYNVKENSELLIGEQAKDFIARASEVNLRPEKIKEFFSNVVKFFQAAAQYITQKFPLNEELLRHVQVADPGRQLQSKVASLDYLIQRFPALLPTGESLSKLKEQFALFQVTDISSCLDNRVDFTWRNIRDHKLNGSSFDLLADVMLAILTIPHSSAHCERIFSIVKKNKTEFRSSMKPDTLQALIVAKARPDDCVTREYSAPKLVKLKGAYCKALKQY